MINFDNKFHTYWMTYYYWFLYRPTNNANLLSTINNFLSYTLYESEFCCKLWYVSTIDTKVHNLWILLTFNAFWQLCGSQRVLAEFTYKRIHVDVQLDAKVVVQLFSNSSSVNRCALPLLDDCKHLISQIGQVRIKHCFRETNTCADFFVQLGSQ